MQISEQVNLVGSTYNARTALITGGGDMVKQALSMSSKPHFVVGTPGRVRSIIDNDVTLSLRGVRFLVLDEADRVLSGRLSNGLLKDVVSIADRCGEGRRCQVLAFSATGGKGVKEGLERIAGGEGGFVEIVTGRNVRDDEKREGEGSSSEEEDDEEKGEDEESKNNETKKPSSTTPTAAIPAGLKQQYIFMPHSMRDMYHVACVRHLMSDGGVRAEAKNGEFEGSGWTLERKGEEEEEGARSAVVFVGTCERAAHMEGTFRELGIGENGGRERAKRANKRVG